MQIGSWVKVNSKICGEAFLNDQKINMDHKGVIIGWNWEEEDSDDNPTLAQVLWEDGCHFSLHWNEKHLILCDLNEIPINLSKLLMPNMRKHIGVYIELKERV